MKHEGSLGEVCALSLHLCLQLTLSYTCTQALCSQSSLGARVHPGPRGWRRSIPILNPSQMTRAPLCVPWGLGAPGSEGNYWMGAQQAGRRSHGGYAP